MLSLHMKQADSAAETLCSALEKVSSLSVLFARTELRVWLLHLKADL